MRRMLKAKIAGSVLGQVLRLWRATQRLEVRGLEWLDELRGSPIAVWHGRMQCPIFSVRGRRILSMASASADGEIATRSFAPLGISMARGSTGKGGQRALDQLVQWMREGRADQVALTVDGPRGPARKVKPGIIELARALDKPIILASFSARSYWMLRSWDRMLLARPFARALVQFGPPVELPPAAATDQAAFMIKEALDNLTLDLDMELHSRPLWDAGSEPAPARPTRGR
jgi:lysophospholipid acyltransferase (LPLAT)-like uncharacterized protein